MSHFSIFKTIACIGTVLFSVLSCTGPADRVAEERAALQALVQRADLEEGDVGCVALAFSDTLAEPSAATMERLFAPGRLVPISACERKTLAGSTGLFLRDTDQYATLVSLDSLKVVRDSVLAWGLWLRGPTWGGEERCAIPRDRLEATPTCVTIGMY